MRRLSGLFLAHCASGPRKSLDRVTWSTVDKGEAIYHVEHKTHSIILLLT